MQITKVSFSDNLGDNNLELYKVLKHTQLTASKPKPDIYYSKFGKRFSSRVVKRLKS